MGVWGTGFWQNDVALDVKEDFAKYYKFGLSDEEGLDYLLSKTISIDEPVDGPVATMVIAGELWKKGRLTEEWLDKAEKAALEDLKYWAKETDADSYTKHERAVKGYIKKLHSQQPERKKMTRKPIPAPFVNTWSPGDILAVKCNKKFMMRKTRDSNPRYYSGGILVFIVEEIHEKYISVFAKFDPEINSFEELTLEKLFEIPYIKQRINLYIEYESQAIQYRKIGNCIDLSQRNDVIDEYEYNIISDLIPESIIQDYFYFEEGYNFNVMITD
ncbi:MAG: hypothetical protein ACI4K7_05055 [Oscillospiraceae bacterium]